MREAVIVSAVRTAVGRAPRGCLRNTRPDDLAGWVVREALRRAPGVKPEDVEDVVIGCSFPEAEQGLNVARLICYLAGLPYTVPGQTINRFCSSGLQAIATGAEHIMCGFADVIIAGGVESMSMVPMGGNKTVPNLKLIETYPEGYTAMGVTAENVARKFGISREDQDGYALKSHQKAWAAIQGGKFKDEILPVNVKTQEISEEGKMHFREFTFATDEGVRAETSMEALGKLRPAFAVEGTVTPGNSAPLNDGAAAVLLLSKERAKSLGLKPLATFRTFAVAGVPPELMGIGPVEAIPKALKLAGLDVKQIDLIELNEAFASQALYVCRNLGLDMEKVNVNGGALALGHALGNSGARLTTTLVHEMKRRNARYGLVSMCIGFGMGAAGVFEREPNY
ncbi:MAG: acetyl-CoA C-acyltransferase [Deltaproteobacteria bacterium]|nr:acetyl-CoA C-acyltransferase [Deltaproteobacteria bacterium]